MVIIYLTFSHVKHVTEKVVLFPKYFFSFSVGTVYMYTINFNLGKGKKMLKPIGRNHPFVEYSPTS